MRPLLARLPVHTMRYDYATGNILKDAWGQVLAATPAPACAVEIYDASGRALSISLGEAGSEDSAVVPYTITPNGSSILLPIEVARGKRISVKPLDADAIEGQLIMNFFG